MTIKIAINGVITDESSAKISVLDRGFLYGDSIYEVIRTYQGRPFALEEHLDRLNRSASLLNIPLPMSLSKLTQEILSTLHAAANPESYIRIIITRGSGPINLDPSAAIHPCRVIIISPLHPFSPDLYEKGVPIYLIPSGRDSAGAVSLAAKSGNYLVNIMALNSARQQGGHEAVLLDSKGRISEGASSNIFAIIGKQLWTPPLSVGILEGITRHKVIELAKNIPLEVQEKELRPKDLKEAKEIFLTSTIREVLPVTHVNNCMVGNGRVGPIARKLRIMYHELTQA